MRWFRKPPDLSLSNEYQDLTRGGCINCGALHDVLRSVTGYNWSALHDILTSAPTAVNDQQEGCWAYAERADYPACLAKLKDDDPKVIQARNEIIQARKAIKVAEEQYRKERAKQLRKVGKRRLP
jgi:hypothetical protein